MSTDCCLTFVESEEKTLPKADCMNAIINFQLKESVSEQKEDNAIDFFIRLMNTIALESIHSSSISVFN
jgi:hypothetical protein